MKQILLGLIEKNTPTNVNTVIKDLLANTISTVTC